MYPALPISRMAWMRLQFIGSPILNERNHSLLQGIADVGWSCLVSADPTIHNPDPPLFEQCLETITKMTFKGSLQGSLRGPFLEKSPEGFQPARLGAQELHD